MGDRTSHIDGNIFLRDENSRKKKDNICYLLFTMRGGVVSGLWRWLKGKNLSTTVDFFLESKHQCRSKQLPLHIILTSQFLALPEDHVAAIFLDFAPLRVARISIEDRITFLSL